MTVRPEIDDENIERLNDIVDASVSVPLSSDDLSINKQLEILTKAVDSKIQETKGTGSQPTIIDDWDSRE